MDRQLVIFIKAPVAGEVKTRLVPPLTFEQAAGAYKSWAQDLYKRFSSLKFLKVQIAYKAHPNFPNPQWLKGDKNSESSISQKLFFKNFQDKIPYFLQKGKDLGERLIHAFSHTFREGAKTVVLIGSDSPGLPLAYIKEAFHALKKSDLVIGPSLDGGYYLIALNQGVKFPKLIQNIPWSSSCVLKKTLQNAKKLNLKVHLLPEYFDIDEPNDLQFLNLQYPIE
ncbi:MAG: TIGR04282 family arsenosugar biosynthesis glycosyltransferase [Elusimicrobia bacterium]|nr:TIGR04282 family arsenosugar biosynthesis glycosyltransferase [Elusimicrobiota bacterium]